MSEIYRKTISKYHIRQSMNSAGGRCHDNARCESMWAGRKSELIYGQYDTDRLLVEKLKSIVWRYFISYWNKRRAASEAAKQSAVAINNYRHNHR